MAPGQSLTNEYLMVLLESEHMQRWMQRRTKGAGVKGINLGDVKEIPIPIPPKKLQVKFSDFFNQLRKQQTHDSQYCFNSENLFSSLLQRAFKGDL